MSLPATITMKKLELHHAALSVALVYGIMGGFGASFTGFWWLGPIFGFALAWIACKYAFPSAHAYYHASSIAHRIYDLTAAASGAGTCLAILRYCT